MKKNAKKTKDEITFKRQVLFWNASLLLIPVDKNANTIIIAKDLFVSL